MQEVNRFAGVRCGGEDGPLVVFQDFQPLVDVPSVVLANLRRDAQIRTEKRGAQLGDKLFYRVAFIAESFPAKITIEPRRMSRPVRQFVGQRRRVAFRVAGK